MCFWVDCIWSWQLLPHSEKCGCPSEEKSHPHKLPPLQQPLKRKVFVLKVFHIYKFHPSFYYNNSGYCGHRIITTFIIVLPRCNHWSLILFMQCRPRCNHWKLILFMQCQPKARIINLTLSFLASRIYTPLHCPCGRSSCGRKLWIQSYYKLSWARWGPVGLGLEIC